MDDRAILDAIQGSAEALLERHLTRTKEWFPHQLVPWSRGRDFQPDEEWDPDEFALPEAVRSALFVNLLTEDNLPYYYSSLSKLFSDDGVWGEWSRRWTAEEHRHSIVIRDWLTVTRALDPVELERARMAQVSVGFVHGANIPSACDGVVYVTLQELATRISHRNTGRLLGESTGSEIMTRVAADENLHFLFYRDVTSAALEADPSTLVLAIERQVRGFDMPGTGIKDFGSHAGVIADAGIYDFTIHHSQILVPVVLRHWQLETIEGLTPEADKARGRTVRYINRMERVSRRLVARRDEQLASTPK
jgi:acyl-[acyl-carrier-protein] desaturase